MSTLKVNTVLSADTPTVNIADGLSISGVSTFTDSLGLGLGSLSIGGGKESNSSSIENDYSFIANR